MYPIQFPVFDKVFDSMENMNQIQQCLLCLENCGGEAVKLDLTRGRVAMYNNIVELANGKTWGQSYNGVDPKYMDMSAFDGMKI